MYTSQVFRDIVRPCPECEISFDIRLHAPHMLSCSHTFCLMCLSKNDQRKKRHCFICKAKYSKFSPNLALMEAVQRVEERCDWLESEAAKCDECHNQVPTSLMRCCESCVQQFVDRTDMRMDCLICLECCVNSHNGHRLVPLDPFPPPTPMDSPMVQRARLPSTSSAVSVRFRQPTDNPRITTKGLIKSIKSWSFRTSNTEFSFLLNTPISRSKLAFSEEDIVMESSTPFYDPRKSLARHNTMSSSRFMCLDALAANLEDSVFEDSPQSTVSQVQYQHHPPITLQSFQSPPQKSRFSHSAMSLRQAPPTYSNFGTIRPWKNRIRMGVADIMNNNHHRIPTTRIPIPCSSSTPIYPRQQLKPTRSEGSVFGKVAENQNYHLY